MGQTRVAQPRLKTVAISCGGIGFGILLYSLVLGPWWSREQDIAARAKFWEIPAASVRKWDAAEAAVRRGEVRREDLAWIEASMLHPRVEERQYASQRIFSWKDASAPFVGQVLARVASVETDPCVLASLMTLGVRLPSTEQRSIEVALATRSENRDALLRMWSAARAQLADMQAHEPR